MSSKPNQDRKNTTATMYLPELLDLIPDDMSLNDFFPEMDCTRDYVCPFCGKTFQADGDAAELVVYYKRYGCGCMPDCVVEAILDTDLNPLQVEHLRIKTDKADKYCMSVNGTRAGVVNVSAYDRGFERWFERSGGVYKRTMHGESSAASVIASRERK